MCTGHTHVPGGLAAGGAIALYRWYMPPHTVAALTVCTEAFATVPGLNKRGSCAAVALGPVPDLVATVIGRVTCGHRHLTYAIPGAAAFAGLAWLGGHYRHHLPGRIGPALLLALAFAGQPPERYRWRPPWAGVS